MENFQLPSIPSMTTITSSAPQETHSQFSVCEPMTSFPSTIGNPGADQYSYYPAEYLVPNPGLQFQHGYDYNPYQQASQPMTPFLVNDQQNMALSTELDSMESERRRLGALICKAARNERRMALARQRSISLSRSNASAAVSSSRRHAPFYGCNGDGVMSSSSSGAGAGFLNTKKHLYPFCTIDNKKLRVLFKKELKKTDVGSLGRIVLPKKEAEENLPMLFNKEGIHLVIRDVHSDQEWGLKYKYWSNNRSRMYVLENTGSFVMQKELQAGDCFYLYEDECKNLYISAEKIARPAQVAESSSQLTSTVNPINQNIHNSNSSSCNPTPNLEVLSTELSTTVTTTYTNTNHSEIAEANTTETNENISAQYTYEARDEEDTSSLARLMEQLQQEQEANRKLVLSKNPSSSSYYTTNEEATTTTSSINFTSFFETFTQPSTLARIGPLSSSSTSSSSLLNATQIQRADEDQLDDCYKGLGTLPEVECYKYSHYIFDDNRDDDKP